VPDQHSNFAVSTVATAPSPASSGTSLSVASGEGARFPAAPFNATVRPANAPPDPSNAEIIRVTARSTDSFGTIVRAQEGSTARSIQVGDHISATITAKSLTDIEAATSLYKPITDWRVGSVIAGGVAATTLMFAYVSTVAVAAASSAVCNLRLNPADFPTSKLKVQGQVVTNAVAPAINFAFHLYPIATWGGASGANPTIASLGTSLGSGTVTAPASGGPSSIAESADFDFPAAGSYALAVVTSGTTAANSDTYPFVRLLRREA
jgi:hypothetical protein